MRVTQFLSAWVDAWLGSLPDLAIFALVTAGVVGILFAVIDSRP